MEAVLFYSGKVILYSGALFAYYHLCLRGKTFHHYNRFYLLSAMLISLLLPLLKASYFMIEVNDGAYLLMSQFKLSSYGTGNDEPAWLRIFSITFGLISFLLATRFFFGIFKILKLKKRFRKESFEAINFYQTDLNNAPFSYFKNLFWKNTIEINSTLGRQILKHEMAHIEQKHTYDKIFIGILKSVFWFNPFFYLIKKELHLIHEYLADEKAVHQSDTKAFAQMLLVSRFSPNIIPVSSPLLSSHLKNRINMLKTPKTRFSYVRRIFALPLLFAMLFASLVGAKNREIKAAAFEITEPGNRNKKNTAIARSDRETFSLNNRIPAKTKGLKQQQTGDVKYVKSDVQNLPQKNPEQLPGGMPERPAADITGSGHDFKFSGKEIEKVHADAASIKIAAEEVQERAHLARKQAAAANRQAESAKQCANSSSAGRYNLHYGTMI
ncbi:MAG TPA: M56 family metallopeptidase [Flavipsychrobacter sp.]|nr:M56 family metallopeptidase [Flavipsychrobacter sp.]